MTVFTHPDQPELQAEVILASKGPYHPTLYTIRGRYPLIIHSEVLTHRSFNRNARSSRAVPVARMIEEVRERPFVPWHWLKNQPGMQGGEPWYEILDVYHDGAFRKATPKAAWLLARKQAVDVAEAFAAGGCHKQIANRLLAPFLWIDVLITATEWDNFFWLRDHKDAEPHLQDWVRLVRKAIDAAEPEYLEPGEWHLPYITDADVDVALRMAPVHPHQWLCKISAARCARISYAPFDGDASYESELRRANALISGERLHASPFEHAATPDRWDGEGWISPHKHGPLKGWIQARHQLLAA